MATSRIIWGKWDCHNCSTKGISAEPPPGETQPKCPGCGSPREAREGEAAYLDNAKDASGRVLDANVADTPEELSIARSGADWTCARCGGDNRAGRENCEGCGAARGEGRSVLAAAPAVEPVAGAAPPPSGFGRVLALGLPAVGCGIFAVAAMACGGYYWWSHRTHETTGSVVATHWTHHSERQTFAAVVAEGWQSDVPRGPPILPTNGSGEYAGAENVRDCGDRHHHDEQYACGTENVCHTETRSVSDGQSCSDVCTTSDNGNGSFTETCSQVCTPNSHSESYQVCADETKYCSRAVMATWCTWDSRAWQAVESADLKGDSPAIGTTLGWPVLEAGANERVTRVGVYQADVSWTGGDGKPHSYSTVLAGEPELFAWSVGRSVKLVVNRDDVCESVSLL